MKPIVVQFPHPGGEHLIDGNYPSFSKNKIKHNLYMPWNDGEHRRKFIQSTGRYIDKKGEQHETENQFFWGEWESPSCFYFSHTKNSSPYIIHNKLITIPPKVYETENVLPYRQKIKLQNTDPYVFGDSFKYAICRQDGVMLDLDPGSIIIFGSTIKGKFVLDTVFVVSDRFIEYEYDLELGFFIESLVHKGEITRTYANASLLPFYNEIQLNSFIDFESKKYRIYFGASFDNQIAGMYSFFPCSISGEFERTDIKNIGINPNAFRNIKILDVSPEAAWCEIVKQLLNKGLLLGVYAAEPTLI